MSKNIKIKKVFSFEVQFELDENTTNEDGIKLKDMDFDELNMFLDDMESYDGLLEKCNDSGMWEEINMMENCDWYYKKITDEKGGE